jgi:hypothetical protein
MTVWKKATLAVALGASTLAAATPAEAQRWRRGGYRDNGAGVALAAGIAGLAIGAALNSRDRYNPRYDYDYRYYDQRGYFPQNGYYARNYYNRGWNRCVVRRVYDPYIGRRVRVRYC